jgi:hypothetical protein
LAGYEDRHLDFNPRIAHDKVVAGTSTAGTSPPFPQANQSCLNYCGIKSCAIRAAMLNFGYESVLA